MSDDDEDDEEGAGVSEHGEEVPQEPDQAAPALDKAGTEKEKFKRKRSLRERICELKKLVRNQGEEIAKLKKKRNQEKANLTPENAF